MRESLLLLGVLVALTAGSPALDRGHPGDLTALRNELTRTVPVSPLKIGSKLHSAMSTLRLPPLYRTGPSKTTTKRPAIRAPGDADPYRLGKTVMPFQYELHLDVNMVNLTFVGRVVIRVNVLEETDTIVLHAGDNIMLESSSITVEAYQPDPDTPTVQNITRSDQYETLTIALERPLQRGSHYVITFNRFESELNRRLSGFYRSSYTAENGQTRWLATTQFEPTLARQAFPCFDEPSFKARFNIEISHAAGLTARSNMPGTIVQSAQPDAPVVTKFDVTPPMSTYLLAWVVSDFANLSNADGSFNTWARNEIIGGASLSQEVGQSALRELGEYTGIPFALPKTDQFAIPDFSAGAMENWGLVTYRETFLIVMRTSDIRYVQQIRTVICHELGHQWSGNLVTLDWWSDTWLNEGFATFFESFICDKIYPELKLMDQWIPAYSQGAMDNDAAYASLAMSSNVSTYDEIENKFDVTSYSKGGSVLRMFQHILTPTVFQDGLKQYFSTNMYKTTSPEHLFRALSSAARVAGVQLPVAFTELAKSWTEQPGVPLVRVTRDYRGNITFTQEEFRLTGQSEGRKWFIPISFAPVASNSRANSTMAWTPTHWLTPLQPSITIHGDDLPEVGLIVNQEQIGYYRVAYDEKNWELLLSTLADGESYGRLTPATRSQILSDLLAGVEAGMIEWSKLVMFLEPLRFETEASVWMTASTTLDAIALRLVNTEVYPAFKMILSNITDSSFKTLGFVVKPEDNHNTRLLRSYVTKVACDAGNDGCIKEASELLTGIVISNRSQEFHPDVFETGLCHGIAGSDESVFNAVVSVWEAAQMSSRLWSQLASGLTCSRDEQLITRFLDRLLLPQADKEVFMRFFVALNRRPHLHRFTLEYIKQNVAKIDTFFGDTSSLVSIVVDWIGTITTDAEYTEVINNFLAEWYRRYYNEMAHYIYMTTNVPEPSPAPTAPTVNPTGPTRPTQPGPPPGPPTTPSKSGSAPMPAATLLNLAALLVACIAWLQ